jgi:hypothetical protein
MHIAPRNFYELFEFMHYLKVQSIYKSMAMAAAKAAASVKGA